jgi:multidrug transporter EmrE-like cation transporter
MRYALLFGTTALMASGQILFKLAAATPGRWAFLVSLPFLGALCVYSITTVTWVLTLRQWPIGTAYPAQAVAIVLVTLAGIVLFGERPSLQHWVGVSVIMIGLIVLMEA